jgi:ABC-type transport system involved in multi-copper enzyme maturation permease subunit
MTVSSSSRATSASRSGGSGFSGILWAELHRWIREPAVLTTIAGVIAFSGLLTYFAVSVATGGSAAGGEGVQLQTDVVLDANATNAQLASMPRSSLTMLVPIAAIVLGVQAAGSEMASGALLQLAVAARRLRFLFAARAVILLVLLGVAGAGSALATLVATGAGAARATELAHLSAWNDAAPIIAGATAQSILVGFIAFGLAALSRRWIAVTVGMIVYLVGLEPILSGLIGEGSVWLPRAATSELMLPGGDPARVLPTLVCALVLVATAVLSLRREWAAR